MTSFSCALVGAASFDERHFTHEHFECVVAVDGGYASLTQAGADPDFALGDFDSLGYVPRNVPIEEHPSMKDDSDTALALDWARLQGHKNIAVYGALGGRLDHTMATLQALVGAAQSGLRVVAIGEGSVVVFLHANAEAPHPATLHLPASCVGTLSVFSATDASCGVTIDGLMYGADNVTLANNITLGLSNEFIGTPSRISVACGTLMVFLPTMPLENLRFE